MDSVVRELTSQAGQGAVSIDDIFTPWVAVPTEHVDLIQQSLPSAFLQYSAEHTQAVVVAQYFDQDLFGDVGKAWDHFIKSGQVWALLIGLVVGYMFRGMTTY